MRLILPIVAVFVAPILLVLGGARLIRLLTNREANRKADELIMANRARWCEERDGTPMDHADWPRIEREGERRWQEMLRAQRRTRKPVEPRMVVFRGDKRA